MKKICCLENKFKDKFIHHGNINFLSKEDSICFLRELNDLDIKLLGIDGFHNLITTIRPDTGFVVDFSYVDCKKVIFSRSLKFLEECPDDMIFEFVY